MDTLYTTHQCIPFLNTIEGIDTNIKVFHEAEDLNPKQQVYCKEFVNHIPYFLNIWATAWDVYEVICPELACISQCIPNIS